MLLVHGRDDTLVPTDFTERFADALRAGGHRVEVEFPQGVDHASGYSAAVAGPIVAGWLGIG